MCVFSLLYGFIHSLTCNSLIVRLSICACPEGGFYPSKESMRRSCYFEPGGEGAMPRWLATHMLSAVVLCMQVVDSCNQTSAKFAIAYQLVCALHTVTAFFQTVCIPLPVIYIFAQVPDFEQLVVCYFKSTHLHTPTSGGWALDRICLKVALSCICMDAWCVLYN